MGKLIEKVSTERKRVRHSKEFKLEAVRARPAEHAGARLGRCVATFRSGAARGDRRSGSGTVGRDRGVQFAKQHQIVVAAARFDAGQA